MPARGQQAQYEAGKLYLVDGTTLNRYEKELKTLRILEGDGYTLERHPGEGTILHIEPASILPPQPWDLSVVDSDTGTVSVALGKVRDLSDTVTGELTVDASGAPYAVGAGGFLTLEITDHNPLGADLVYYGAWPIANGRFAEVDGTGDFARFVWPLWQFLGAETTVTTELFPGVHARRCVHGDLVVVATFVAVDDDGQRIMAPALQTM